MERRSVKNLHSTIKTFVSMLTYSIMAINKSKIVVRKNMKTNYYRYNNRIMVSLENWLLHSEDHRQIDIISLKPGSLVILSPKLTKGKEKKIPSLQQHSLAMPAPQFTTDITKTKSCRRIVENIELLLMSETFDSKRALTLYDLNYFFPYIFEISL